MRDCNWGFFQSFRTRQFRNTIMENLQFAELHNKTLQIFLWNYPTVILLFTSLGILLAIGLTSKIAIIKYIRKNAPKRPINSNILIDQVMFEKNSNVKKNQPIFNISDGSIDLFISNGIFHLINSNNPIYNSWTFWSYFSHNLLFLHFVKRL